MESNKTVWWVACSVVVLGLLYWAFTGSSGTPSQTASSTNEYGTSGQNTHTNGSTAGSDYTGGGTAQLKYSQWNVQRVTLVDASGSPKSLGLSDHGIVHTARISAATKLLNKNRAPLAFSQIQKGDVVNVYGSIRKDGSIDAIIIRDLSQPTGVAAGSVSISNVTGPSLVATGLQSTWTIDADVPGTETVTYIADWQDGSPVDSLSNPALTHTYTRTGVYVIKFSVKSSSGKSASWMLSVNVVAPGQ